MQTSMTIPQMAVTVGVVVLATVSTRFLPYLLFPEGRKVPKFILYLGKVLGPAVFGLLVVYCLRNVSFVSGNHGVPEILASATVIALYLWKRNMILPMAGGTAVYMLLVQAVFR
ncbi:branched-chain amino acid transporter permease [Clostridium vitabionis]|uniref:branched-chain amino acid transporter permease n=1 Tax=Clostridium vitabionis TaxID=2784388 RepID=UPI001F4515CE|nr:branched-chain amino acid transporter permease [Clostridium vitabionis]